MEQKKSQYTTFQRILALIGVILLISLAILAFVFSILDFPGSDRLAWGFLVTAIFLPIIIWIFIWLYGQTTQKRTIASILTKEQQEIRDRAEEIREEMKNQKE